MWAWRLGKKIFLFTAVDLINLQVYSCKNLVYHVISVENWYIPLGHTIKSVINNYDEHRITL